MMYRPLAYLIALTVASGAASQGLPVVQADEETRNTSTATVEQDRNARNGPLSNFDGTGNFSFFDGTNIYIAAGGAGIYQDGKGSEAHLEQVGHDNRALIRQSNGEDAGTNNATARILQGESGATAEHGEALIDQRGDGGTAVIEQNGSNLRSVGLQISDGSGNQDGAESSGQGANEQTHKLSGSALQSEIMQSGRRLSAEMALMDASDDHGGISQTGTGHKASYSAKAGEGRSGFITQDAEQPSEADGDITGNGHTLDIEQTGKGGQHAATVAQSGADHSIDLQQQRDTPDGEGNTATIDQSGTAAVVTGVQTGAGGNILQVGQEGENSNALEAKVNQTGSGGGNKADVDQTGDSQLADISQSGSGGGSLGAVDQSTDGSRDNVAKLEQMIEADTGTDDIDIDQSGDANLAEVVQTRTEGGTGHLTTIAQPGKSNEASVEQDGVAHKAALDQNGTTNRADARQAGAGGHEADIDQAGRENVATLDQAGDGGANIGSIDQSATDAEKNQAELSQQGARGLNTADIDQSQTGNRATIGQRGDSGGTGNKASITQPGRRNDGRIDQSGGALEASLSLNGAENSAEIVQSSEEATAKAQITTASGVSGNTAMIRNRTGGGVGSIDQTSDDNSAGIDMTNGSPTNGTNEADIDQGGSGGHDAQIRMEGSGTSRTARIAQGGEASTVELRLSGPGSNAGVNVQQSGARNTVRSESIAQDNGELTVAHKQDGTGNETILKQDGQNLKVTINQIGENNTVELTQTGEGYAVTITQRGNGQHLSLTLDGPKDGGGDYTYTQTGE